MYFPTYRRVEEDLHNLGYSDDELLDQEDNIIQFGMRDVKNRFKKIENTINSYLKEGFSKITSEILSQLVKGFSNIDMSFLDRINNNDIEIILARVGNQLSIEEKNAIKNIVLNQNVEKNSLPDSSIYFLQKLVEIYEKQKSLDNSVKLFRDVCNKYLVSKKVFYDESKIRIFIKSDKNYSEIPLSKLSSGEKQIISMFSKLYLSNSNKRYIVLFDEPELSLSMDWQKQLLPDIINSKKCDFLLAVTHSPFIFENELDRFAIGLNEYSTLSSNLPVNGLVDINVIDFGDFHDIPVIEVLVKPGDIVEKEDSIITLESDKATMELPSPYKGVIEEVLVNIGDKVNVGSLIARVRIQ